MKTKYLWVVAACAVLSGSHSTCYSAAFGTKLALDAGLQSLAMPDVPENIAAIQVKQIESISMMEIEVLNNVPETLSSITMSHIGLLTGSETDTFNAAVQPQATETLPNAKNPLFTLASELAPSVPEPETWAMLLAGLGLIGLQLRRGHGGRIDIH